MSVEAVQEQQVRAVGLERRQELTELEIGLTARRETLGGLIAVGLESKQDATRRLRGLGVQRLRPHGVEKGQGKPEPTHATNQGST